VKRITIIGAVIAVQVLVGSRARAQEQDSIRFVVTGLESEEGHVLCALFDSERTWLTEERLQVSRSSIRDGRAVCVFEEIPPGDYAISAFHDADDDYELDRGAFGIPVERYCASRNARRPLAPPRFVDASFSHLGRSQMIRARMR
jgi:uncharacterized protein (DUF2141 family)